MKISQMTNDQAADALIRLSEPFAHLCEDDEVVKIIDAYNTMSKNKQPVIQTIGKMIPKVVAYLLKSHKVDLYEIVGALTFATTEDVAGMNFVETVNTIKESYDEILQGFFTSSVKQTKS